jgi:hypothetical protein
MNDAQKIAALLQVARAALTALNTAHRFTVGSTDSYAIAARIERVLRDVADDPNQEGNL